MVSLKSCEILDELKILGISSSDLIQYVIEYAAYYYGKNLQIEDLND